MTYSVGAKLNESTKKKRREKRFDLTTSNTPNPKPSQPAWTARPSTACYETMQRKCFGSSSSDVALRNYLLRLNDLYAEDLQEIQIKADVAKLVATGELEKPAKDCTLLSARGPCIQRYVPGGRRAAPTVVMSRDHMSRGRSTSIDVAAKSVLQAQKKQHVAASSPNLLDWEPVNHVTTVHCPAQASYNHLQHGNTVVTSQGAAVSRKAPASAVRLYSGKKEVKKVPVRLYRPRTAPPLSQLDSEADEEQSPAVRIPSTMTEEEDLSSTPPQCHSSSSLIIRMDAKLPKEMIDKKCASEKAIVLREKRKREMMSRRKEELALEKKLRFKPRYIHITHPQTPPVIQSKVSTRHAPPKNKTPTKTVKQVTSDFSRLNLKNLSSIETGLTNEDIKQFVHQSKLTREMLNINVKNNKLSMVFDERSSQCEKMLRKEIQKHRPAKNPTFCIL